MLPAKYFTFPAAPFPASNLTVEPPPLIAAVRSFALLAHSSAVTRDDLYQDVMLSFEMPAGGRLRVWLRHPRFAKDVRRLLVPILLLLHLT